MSTETPPAIDQQAEAEKILRSLGYVPILWHIDDVRKVAQEDELGTFTDDECLEVLDGVCDNHDADVGVDWIALGEYAAAFASQRAD